MTTWVLLSRPPLRQLLPKCPPKTLAWCWSTWQRMHPTHNRYLSLSPRMSCLELTEYQCRAPRQTRSTKADKRLNKKTRDLSPSLLSIWMCLFPTEMATIRIWRRLIARQFIQVLMRLIWRSRGQTTAILSHMILMYLKPLVKSFVKCMIVWGSMTSTKSKQTWR